jgi:hypothetical protein
MKVNYILRRFYITQKKSNSKFFNLEPAEDLNRQPLQTYKVYKFQNDKDSILVPTSRQASNFIKPDIQTWSPGTASPPTAPKAEMNLLTSLMNPREICSQLNEHVIGQHPLKKTLSVAIYNHYTRISKMQLKMLSDEDLVLEKRYWLYLNKAMS